jgi:hypothetical protein
MNKIHFHLATMPPRIEALKDSIPSILPQCDKLFVYLNCFGGHIPDILKHPKITIYESEKEFDGDGNLGDVGKFYGCDDWEPGYHFTVDDKLIYPPTYTRDMIAAIEKHGRKAVVSIHGRNFFTTRKCKSYYFDVERFFGCLQNHPEQFVHEIGTGVMAFHTDTIKISMDWFPRINMTDILLSVELQKRNIPMLLAAHKTGYIRISTRHDDTYSIHAQCNRKDQVQTDLVNSIRWRINSCEKVKESSPA